MIRRGGRSIEADRGAGRWRRLVAGLSAALVGCSSLLAVTAPSAHAAASVYAVTDTITVGAFPSSVAVNPNTGTVYVSNTDGGSVSVIDGATDNVTATIPVAKPYGIAVNPNTGTVYTATSNVVPSGLSVIDGTTNTVAGLIDVGNRAAPWSVAVNPATDTVYVTDLSYVPGLLWMVDGITDIVTAKVSMNVHPISVAVNPNTGRVYVAHGNGASVWVMDDATHEVLATIPIAGTADSVAVNPNTGRVYVASNGVHGQNPAVVVIDGETNTPLDPIALGWSPSAVAVDPVADLVYVVGRQANVLAVIDGATNTVIQTLSVGSQPNSVAVNPVTGTVYVVNQGSNTVSVINGPVAQSITFASSAPAGALVGGGYIVTAIGGGSDMPVVFSSGSAATCTVTTAGSVTFVDVGLCVIHANQAASGGYTAAPQVSQSFPVSPVAAATVVTGTTLTAGPSSGPDLYLAGSVTPNAVKLSLDSGQQSPVGSGLAFARGVAVDAAGNVYLADTSNHRVVKVPADGGPQATVSSGLLEPSGVAVDIAGNVYIVDGLTDRLVKVPADGGPPTTVGSDLVAPYGVAVDAAGNVYVTDPGAHQVVKLPAGGGPQLTLPIADLTMPYGVAVDAAGNLFLADSFNNRVVKVPADGSAQSILPMTGLDSPWGIAVDAAGNVYVADVMHNRVVKLPAGGGPQEVLAATDVNNPYGLAIATPPTSVTPGQLVTLTATEMASDGSIPTGTITFAEGGIPLGTATLVGGVATFTTTALPEGTHHITASYAGGDGLSASTSAAVTVIVADTDPDVEVGTTTGLAVAPAGAAFGQQVTLTATVGATPPAIGTPTGLVTFSEGGTTLGTGTLNSSGVATLAVSTLAVGGHSIIATYAGDDGFIGSVSSAVTVTIAKAATGATLMVAPSSLVAGQQVTLTATVVAIAPGTGTPTGTVTFVDLLSTLGTGTLDAAGVARLQVSTLGVGTHAISAQYGGDSSYGPTGSVLVPVVVSAVVVDYIVVSPDVSVVAAGGSQEFTAAAYDATDTLIGDVTAATTFTADGGVTCTGASCLATSAGVVTVTGTFGLLTGTAVLVVFPGAVQSLVVSPPSATVAAGVGQPFTAVAFDEFGNLVGDVTGDTVFTVDGGAGCSEAVCTATAAGDYTVTGTYAPGPVLYFTRLAAAPLAGSVSTSSTASLHVTAAEFDHLVIGPPTTTVVVGTGQAYTAAAFDEFGNLIGDVTGETAFTIDGGASCAAATCTPLTAGSYTVTGIYSATSAIAALTATAVAAVITPPAPDVPAGDVPAAGGMAPIGAGPLASTGGDLGGYAQLSSILLLLGIGLLALGRRRIRD